jgi:hypothetical protein
MGQIKTSFDHASAGMEESCLWAQGNLGSGVGGVWGGNRGATHEPTLTVTGINVTISCEP